MAKAKRKSSASAPVSPQVAFLFAQLRAHGQSPAAAIEYLTKAIQSGDAVSKPEMPDGWQLEVAGDEVFVVWRDGRRNARDFSLYRPRPRSHSLDPGPVPPEVMAKLYPPGYKPPKLSRAAQRSRLLSTSLQERARALFEQAPLSSPLPSPPNQPADPAFTAALYKIADALKPPNKPEVPKKIGGRRIIAEREKRPPQIVGEAIIAKWCAEKGYPKGVPEEVATHAVWRMMKAPKRWDTKCVELGYDANEVRPPKTWHTVDAWIGRR
jgi:hypothetical protein